MINSYLKLQYTLLTRHIKATGLPIPVAVLVFIGLCFLTCYALVQYPVFGSYALLLGNFQLLFLLTEKNRNDFLKNTFNKKDFYTIRLVENSLVILPSFIILLVQRQWMQAMALPPLSLVFVFITLRTFGRSIPTPFTRKPFEFILGFRRSYPILLVLYLLAAIGFYVANPNLVLFCVACITLTSVFYYQLPEPEFYLWNHRHRPAAFLFRKFRRGVGQCLVYTLPLLVIYSVIFPEILFHAILLLTGIFFLVPFVITLKYVAYPREINFPEGFALALCFSFYPLILALFPFYYSKALKNLKSYL